MTFPTTNTKTGLILNVGDGPTLRYIIGERFTKTNKDLPEQLENSDLSNKIIIRRNEDPLSKGHLSPHLSSYHVVDVWVRDLSLSDLNLGSKQWVSMYRDVFNELET